MPTSRQIPSIISVKLSKAQRAALAELLPQFRERLRLDEPGTRAVSLTSSEAAEIEEKAASAWMAARGTKRTSLRKVRQALERASAAADLGEAIPAGQRVYQFKITLQQIRPPIWRRIQVKDCTLDELHEQIQLSMGWTNSHLHQFLIDGRSFGNPDMLEDFDAEDSRSIRLSALLPVDGKGFRFHYEYDFGDGWSHEIVFEGGVQAEKGVRYPLCLKGARACPPEDVGGAWGYQEYLEALTNPKNERHEELLEWSGPFDAEAFDAGTASKQMQRGLPDWEDFE